MEPRADLVRPFIPASAPPGPGGWLRRAARASRRTRQTALLLSEAASHLRRELVDLPDTGLSHLRRQAYARYVAENICAINGFEVRVRGPLPRGPSILVANHVSWQDPILISSQVPTLAVAKSEVHSWPLVGPLASGLDMLFVRRGCAHSGAQVLLRARTLLERGASVLTFPEGTTTDGESILPFRRGMFGLARLVDVPITPIVLRYRDPDAAWIGDESFLPSFSRTVARSRSVAWLDFGPALRPRPGESVDALAARTRRSMLEQLDRLERGTRAQDSSAGLEPRLSDLRPLTSDL